MLHPDNHKCEKRCLSKKRTFKVILSDNDGILIKKIISQKIVHDIFLLLIEDLSAKKYD